MKPILLFFIVCTGLMKFAIAQTPVKDALDLAGFVTSKKELKSDSASLEKIAAILKPYAVSAFPERVGTIVVVDEFRETDGGSYNPFLAAYLPDGTSSGARTISAKSLLTSVGNIGVTNFTDGLARFLVQRSKEELNVAFFRKFKEYIEGKPEIKVVFPATAGIVGSLVSYQYNAMLPALRTAFEKDFNVLTASLLKLREPESYAPYDERLKTIVKFLTTDLTGRALCAALIVADDVRKGENLAEILKKLSSDQLCTTPDNLTGTVRFSNLLSTSLRSSDTDRIWVTRDDLAKLAADEHAIKIFFGLVYALNKKDPVSFRVSDQTKTVESLLSSVNDTWSEIDKGKAFVKAFLTSAEMASDVSELTKNIIEKKKKGEDITKDDYQLYSASIVSFLNSASQVVPQSTGLNANLSRITDTLQRYLAFVDQGVNCYYDIKTRSYSSLVVHVSTMYSTVAKNVKITNGTEEKNKFLKYATFMANLLEANDPESVKDAIEAAVLPVGSSAIKRETYSNISINAYLGPFAGGEYLGATNKSRTSLGLTAPVGIAFSWGNIENGKRKEKEKNNKLGGKSFSFFIPIIDVGAMAAFRLKDPDSETASQVTLKNIIAPGLYGFWGFGKCPVSFGLGAQVGPQLREITSATADLNKNYYIRYGVVLAVDIPLLNLHTRN